MKLPERMRVSGGALQLFLNTASLFGLTVEQRCAILGDISEATYHNWRKEPGAALLTRDQIDRISLLLGILKALRLIFADDQIALSWLCSENADSPFNGASPLDHMTAGSMLDLIAVRQYLDAWLG